MEENIEMEPKDYVYGVMILFGVVFFVISLLWIITTYAMGPNNIDKKYIFGAEYFFVSAIVCYLVYEVLYLREKRNKKEDIGFSSFLWDNLFVVLGSLISAGYLYGLRGIMVDVKENYVNWGNEIVNWGNEIVSFLSSKSFMKILGNGILLISVIALKFAIYSAFIKGGNNGRNNS